MLYSFIYVGTVGDFTFRNNTMSNLVYLNNPSKYFIDLHPDLNCDPAWRIQNIIFESNNFINLQNSNVIIFTNYVNNLNGKRIYYMKNNRIINSTINTKLLMLSTSQAM
jgi:hypothetical protein